MYYFSNQMNRKKISANLDAYLSLVNLNKDNFNGNGEPYLPNA
jgi:hypothetical protein